MANGAFTFQSPEQVRRQQRQDAISGILGQVQQGLPPAADALVGFGQDLGGAIGQAFGVQPQVSPEMQQAQFREQLLGGIDLNDATQLNQAARAAQAQGDLNLANWLADRSIALTPEPAEPITTARERVVEGPEGSQLVISETFDEQGRVIDQRQLGQFWPGRDRDGRGGRGGEFTPATPITESTIAAQKPWLDSLEENFFESLSNDQDGRKPFNQMMTQLAGRDVPRILGERGYDATVNESQRLLEQFLGETAQVNEEGEVIRSSYEIDDLGANTFRPSEFRTDFLQWLDTQRPAQGQAQPVAAQPTTAQPALEIGTVRGGYEYIGGDPALQQSWKKV